MTDFAPLRARLLEWFAAQGRDLPWRVGAPGQRDPYRTWVSEVLLQQTQVARGREYYARFLAAFPSVDDLAAAPGDAVLKAWEGCGYYARARNLHRAAQMVSAAGAFPDSYAGWLALPGIGPYTAAALASLTAGEARAVNDGNVRRVLARVCGERGATPAWVQAAADAFLNPQHPGAHNEALMDLGATICTPRTPRCLECPLRTGCAAYAAGQPTAYPAPKPRAAVKEQRAVALLIGNAEAAVLETRSGKLLGGLAGLPTCDVTAGQASAEAALQTLLDRYGLGARSRLGR
ncbi:A/G-specific adenine glycosylase [Deinococcus lacus]|uniref:Adenine DNA glycosylase n=1 Tax=Deinococcus lacus TaxID=392561 RepID=A0ABW1YF17_9DEIO